MYSAAWLLILAWLHIRLAPGHDGTGPMHCGTAGKFQKPDFSGIRLIFRHSTVIFYLPLLLLNGCACFYLSFGFLKKGFIKKILLKVLDMWDSFLIVLYYYSYFRWKKDLRIALSGQTYIQLNNFGFVAAPQFA